MQNVEYGVHAKCGVWSVRNVECMGAKMRMMLEFDRRACFHEDQGLCMKTHAMSEEYKICINLAGILKICCKVMFHFNFLQSCY